MTETESGTLAEQPLGSLLRNLAAEQFSGIVHIEGSVERILCLDDGRLYLATSSSGPSLRQVFVELGAVDEDGWDRAMAAAPEHGSVMAAILHQGAPPASVEHALRELTVGTLLELLVPDDERFRVVEGETHQLGSLVSFEVEETLSDAGERLQRWSSLRERLPSMATVLRRASTLPPGTASIELDRVQWRILEVLTRPSTLESVIAETGLGAFGIFDELYGLLTAGAVVIDEDVPNAP